MPFVFPFAIYIYISILLRFHAFNLLNGEFIDFPMVVLVLDSIIGINGS